MSFKIGELVIAKWDGWGGKKCFVKGRIACFHDEFVDLIVEKTNVAPTDIKRTVEFIKTLNHYNEYEEREVVQFT